jgi:hypothetical protein
MNQTTKSKFQAGQVWTYKTRPQEQSSTLVIVKIEQDAKQGTIVHVRITGLKIENPYSSDMFSHEISHMPISENALANSVLKMIDDNGEMGNYQEGYDTWRQAFDADEAGIFAIPVAECVSCMEKAVNQSE